MHLLKYVYNLHFYKECFCIFSYSMLIKGFSYVRDSRLGLIPSMRLDGKKDIQSVRSAWSIWVQS